MLIEPLMLTGAGLAAGFAGAATFIFLREAKIAALAAALAFACSLGAYALRPSEAFYWTPAFVAPLVALSVIDARTFVLPDMLNAIFAVLGLTAIFALNPAHWLNHLGAAAIGFALFFSLNWYYLRKRGTDGLGLGDAKLIAGAGLWLGVQALPGLLLVSAVSAIAFMLMASWLAGRALDPKQPAAFGPFIAFSAYVSWLTGPLFMWGMSA